MTPHATSRSAKTTALITASYAPDFERCRLLCDTIDAHVTGHTRHYLLVAHHDVTLFRQLETSRRTVVDERDILPSWLRSFPDPLSRFKRRIWLSLRTKPLRGWHVQQLRRIAIAAHLSEDGLFTADSDTTFLKPFDCGAIWRGEDLRLFRRDGALTRPVESGQKLWSEKAGKLLGIAAPVVSPHDYVATMGIAWRRDTAVSLCRHIEAVNGKHWVAAIGAERQFSECHIYGRFADEVCGGAGHFHDGHEFARVRWFGPALNDDEFRSFIDDMAPGQVAIGMQSFIGTDVERIRRFIAAA